MKKIFLFIFSLNSFFIYSQVINIGKNSNNFYLYSKKIYGPVKHIEYRSESYYESEHNYIFKKNDIVHYNEYEVLFNSDGNAIYEKSYTDGILSKEIIYEYDQNGNCIKDDFYEARYDEQNRVIRSKDFLYFTIYEYPDPYKAVEYSVYLGDKTKIKRSDLSKTREIIFDSNNNIIKTIFFNIHSGKIERENLFLYNTMDLLLNEEYYSFNKYDEKILNERIIYEYENNELIKQIYLGSVKTVITYFNSKIILEEEFSMDKLGRWILDSEIEYRYYDNRNEIYNYENSFLKSKIIKYFYDNKINEVTIKNDEIVKRSEYILDEYGNTISNINYEIFNDELVVTGQYSTKITYY